MIEGGWAHTFASFLSSGASMHNEFIRMVRDAIFHPKKDNAEMYADLKATRHDQISRQVINEECDFINDDPTSE
jgi:hypothetical protein